jgi:hypothetical protein
MVGRAIILCGRGDGGKVGTSTSVLASTNAQRSKTLLDTGFLATISTVDEQGDRTYELLTCPSSLLGSRSGSKIHIELNVRKCRSCTSTSELVVTKVTFS